MGGKLTKKICLDRNEAWWGLKNLTLTFFDISSLLPTWKQLHRTEKEGSFTLKF